MNREKPLDVLINLTQERLDEAGRNLSELSTQRRNAQQQLDALDNYRVDYTEKLQASTNSGVSSANYHNFRRFINTLDEAISQQNSIITQIDINLQNSRKKWHAEKRKLNSYETLKARQERQRQYKEQRREQHASDETSANMYRRNHQHH